MGLIILNNLTGLLWDKEMIWEPQTLGKLGDNGAILTLFLIAKLKTYDLESHF
jgi:hypothetical protein